MTHDVFICHSSKDRTIANAICSTLEQHHIRCWIAPRDVIPGSDYGGEIIEAIGGTKLTVLVFSSNSNESPHVRREVERTISHGIPVLPFRVEEITPSPALEYFISDAHWLDAMTPPLEQHLDHLVGTVRLLLERGAAAQAAVASAASAAAPSTPGETAGPVASVGPPAPAKATISWPTEPARNRPSMPVLAAIAVGAIVVVAGGAFLLSGAGRPGPSQAALQSASPSATTTTTATATAGPSPTTAPSPEPSGAEAAAIAQLAAALPAAAQCDAPEAAPPDSGELASAFCYIGDGTTGSLVYTLYPTVAALRSGYGSWLDYYHLALGTAGSCENGDQMEDAWFFTSTPSVTEGHYFCIVDDAKQANLYWTDETALVLVDLGGDDGVTLDKLYPIWRTNTYDPIRP